MKPRFIVLIDFSSYSSSLLQFAYEWSKKINAELVLVHQTVVSAPALADHKSRGEITNMAVSEALEKLRDFAKSVLPSGTTVDYRITEKKLDIYLPILLREPFHHLVFTGLKGTTILKKIFMGSVAVQIIDHIHELVVALPKDIPHFTISTLYVALNKNYPLNTVDFDRFLELTGHEIRKIIFFSILPSSEEATEAESYLKEVKDQYASKFTTDYILYEGADVFQEVKSIMALQKDALLVVQRGSRMFLDKMFRKFLINDLVYAGNIPLLVLP
ncbi:universal stress protein [Catalinimonas niigatensis]|uniref:universal stress protein n=1 Tax=Catalinimonas niigatensis TaxID=1397264 RepID=UPI002666BBA0|nr:universal stress protein [Catalinimonas niigatensis]WPP49105.1 universal stress protein [Catalinimonas niigatensis]